MEDESIHRHDISDEFWSKLEPILPGRIRNIELLDHQFAEDQGSQKWDSKSCEKPCICLPI